MRLFDRSIVEGSLKRVTHRPLAHYTRIGTLCHLLSRDAKHPGIGSARATPIQFLNDRQELSLGLDILRDEAYKISRNSIQAIIDDLRNTNGALRSDAFQMSFSGDSDELGQWRGYAGNGIGCAIVTDTISVKRAADVAGWVLYDDAKQRTFAKAVLTALNAVSDTKVAEQALVAAASFIKNEGFRPEMEFRLLKFPNIDGVEFRESGDRIVPFVDYLAGVEPLPLTKVVIGPGWQLSRLSPSEFSLNHVVQGINRLLEARNLLKITDIESSKIPYDPK